MISPGDFVRANYLTYLYHSSLLYCDNNYSLIDVRPEDTIFVVSVNPDGVVIFNGNKYSISFVFVFTRRSTTAFSGYVLTHDLSRDKR